MLWMELKEQKLTVCKENYIIFQEGYWSLLGSHVADWINVILQYREISLGKARGRRAANGRR